MKNIDEDADFRVLQPLGPPKEKIDIAKGTSFTEQEFRQYRSEISSSAPGSDISPVSGADVIQTPVCLCGTALALPKKGSQNRDAYNSFVAAWQAALSYREKLAETLRAALDGRFASAERLQRFLDRLEADETAINRMKK